MTVGTYYGDGYSPSNGLILLGSALTYYLSDGSSWGSGAGSYRLPQVRYDHAEVTGSTIRYYLIPPPDSTLYEQTDFDSGDHSAQGTLKAAGPIVLEAQLGGTVAELSGYVLIASNGMTWYGEPRFNFYSALQGSVVPYRVQYTLFFGTWSETSLEQSFSYSASGLVDFTKPVSSPALVSLGIEGPSQIPDQSTAQYGARASYEGGLQRDVTSSAQWLVSPSNLAGISAGLLTTNKLDTPQAELTVSASFAVGGQTQQAQKTVLCRADLFESLASEWPMFQANAGHTGYLPLSLDPATFTFDWSVDLGQGAALNPVTAANGRVYASTFTYFGPGPQFFALDSRDGHTMWSKSYAAFSVNPPSTAYGNVYIQTCNHSSDTWLRAYDGATGTPVFESRHAAQWERYYSPTLFQGKAYVDGGEYGGMYAFDALSGNSLWFLNLQQYDQWTPAVDNQYVYAYVNPGLYVGDRSSGLFAFMIPDANFEWDGYSMNLAPTLGGDADVVVIHDGRLVRFDLRSRAISWQVQSAFQGQPSIARGVIYAIDGSALVALDEGTHSQLWSWSPPNGSPSGTLIVTDSHVLTSTQDAVYAIDLSTHQAAWSYPAGGSLGLGNGQLYIASSNGELTAINAIAAASSRTAALNVDPNVINLASKAPWVTASIEPSDFETTMIDVSTLRLEATVPPEQKRVVIGDVNGNGVPDITVKFLRAALDPLLSVGTDTLDVTGMLTTGEKFACSDEIRVIDPHPHDLAAAVWPNPLNPSGRLTFTTETPGWLRVAMYDVSGRLVRMLIDNSSSIAGHHEVLIDGHDAKGATLSSGVYFYRIETPKSSATGRIVVAK